MTPAQRNLRDHAMARAAERYGFDLTDAEFDAMVAEIQSGSATYLECEKGSIHVVHHQGIAMLAGYNAEHETIATFAVWNQRWLGIKPPPQEKRN